jgi:hydrogenase maturation protease
MNILVAGIGNVLLGDDGFGVEVAQRLAGRALPDGVRVVDFGIRGMDLAYALLDGYDVAILVDVVRRGGAPGTLYVLEPLVPEGPAPGAGDAVPTQAVPDTHGMHPARVMALVEAMGGSVATMRLVGCEPTLIDEDDLVMGLSEPVAAAVEPAAALVETLVADLATIAAAPATGGPEVHA